MRHLCFSLSQLFISAGSSYGRNVTIVFYTMSTGLLNFIGINCEMRQMVTLVMFLINMINYQKAEYMSLHSYLF